LRGELSAHECAELYNENKTLREIAELDGTTAQAVKQKIERAGYVRQYRLLPRTELIKRFKESFKGPA
jgi:predicted DNA-binding protein YlxM (UPF0122 family)